MSRLLHIIIDNKDNFSKTIDERLHGKYPVLSWNIEHYETLLSQLHPKQRICTWIHIQQYGSRSQELPLDDRLIGIEIEAVLKEKLPNVKPFFVTSGKVDRIQSVTGGRGYLYRKIEEVVNEKPEMVQEVQEILDKTSIKKDSYKEVSPETYDIAIITAQYTDELEKIKDVFQLSSNNHVKVGKHVGFPFEFNGKKIIAISQSKMGMVDASILASEILIKYEPAYLIMPGVCGGDEVTNFGDVVVSEKVILLQAGKLTEEKLNHESIVANIDDELLNKIRPFIDDDTNEKAIGLLKNVQTDFVRLPKEIKKKYNEYNINTIKSFVRPIACSTMIIDRKDYFNNVIKEFDRKIVAVEMEGYGIARTCELLNSGKTKALIVKSVMDKTSKKDDKPKEYASLISALFVKALITQNVFEL